MTFSEIAYKMFKKDAKKYRLFILCNVAAIAVLYSFISIVLNKQFMNSSIVDPMISSNIYAPTFFIVMFAGMFIPYSQSVFMKARQKDYGILLSIGMTENEVRKSVIIENLVLHAVSLVAGLMFGTILSLFFLGFIHSIIGISNINVTVSVVSYEMVTVCELILFIISLIVNCYSMVKSTIYAKIKHTEKTESTGRYSIKFIFIGLVITIAGLILVAFFYENNDNIGLMGLLI
ncbi:putative ABC transport system permease protein [Clostridium acetobutylicum]|uniref:(FS) similar to ABC transporter (Permease), YXDM B.subtilis ortholog n=1 Tax=Clostridium acetobutylicum (strain ATCC 824 / DSM 792 / JCM 1419 / IAM 19013 / LMG 5710 / NBRC 13948 / NRRL B-527 / VKM B-1787 / 2291 / W) TaxID=272562 RepID=Q97MX3_CLOAB|nr:MULTISPECIES: FtsX-like permease family protein [Clostridium]AAK78053.1 (FS) similar to ABC transporter (permease), YXDM B.subtilis ortholog [Clostridium acetobutylicum ATCC 824]ADZ19109.1 ABC transporter (permease) [Clostridium acetobutylicum EA 2018]AEI33492.1 ABC transporter permease [Clostridium acetobutylicum DSM 1731]AWV81884.1 ABC transporter permease [Clostridium acetobutylicum]MBC2395434.1 FtsX-like permease family protein [Clostridium acetobutylicum]